MKKLLLRISLLLISLSNYSQELPNIIPLSPEATEIGKYIDMPVDLSTGVPNVTIPILNLDAKGINIPVSLNYHSSGIRVNEIASRNGLGWSMTTSAMITRQVRGIPDDSSEGYINTLKTVEEYNNSSYNQRAFLAQQALDHIYDYETDIYYFNFFGQTGKFFFNQKDKSVIMHTKSDLKINFEKDSNKKIYGWVITTTDGTSYEFGFNDTSIKRETNTTYIKGQQLPAFNQSAFYGYSSEWRLTKIRDKNGNSTSFNYVKKQNKVVTFWNLINHSKEFSSIGSPLGTPSSIVGERIYFSKKEYNPIYLAKIENNLVRVDFEYNQPRIDLVNDDALTDIKLYSKIDNKLIIHYNLNYEYFNSSDTNQHPNFGIENQLKKRLYLKKVVQQKLNNKNKEYLLNYNTNQILPNRFSYSQDFWGYYNGKANRVLYPKTEVKNNTNIVTIDGADRKVSQNFLNACTLKSITYPTKGKTEFVYEPNTLGSVNGEKAFYIGNEYQSAIIPGGQLNNKTGWSEAGKSYSSNFTVSTDFPYYGIVDYSLNVDTNCNSGDNNCPTIQITKINGDVIRAFNTASGQGSFYLPNGNYVLKIQNGFFQTSNNVYVSLRGRKLLSTSENPYTSGLRIQQINFKDANNSIIKNEIYEYHLFDNKEKSSGYALNPPIFYYKRIPHSDCGGCTTDRIESNAIFPLNGQSSSHVTYTNVTKKFTDNSRIESEFSYSPDSAPNSSNIIQGNQYPLVPSLDYSHRRGVLRKKKIFNSFERLRKEKIYTYTPVNVSNEQNLLSTNYRVGKIGDYLGTIRYSNLSERFLIKEVAEKTIFENGNFLVKTTYNYDNGYNATTFPKETLTTNSKGDALKTKMFYVNDKQQLLGLSSESSVAIDKLKSQNRIAEPIQTDTYKGSVLLSRQRTNYKDWGNNIVLPKNVEMLKGNQGLEDRIIYHSYDAKGNPTEVSKKNGTRIVYIWGYHQTQPIAKIENATLSEVGNSTINNLQRLSNLDKDVTSENNLRSALNSLRNNGTYKNKWQVTTYTYNPLIGVNSITDPRGETIYYHYDSFNRLQYVKDSQNNILKEHKYKYKN